MIQTASEKVTQSVNVVYDVFVATAILARLGYSYDDIVLLVESYVTDSIDTERLVHAANKKLVVSGWSLADIKKTHVRVASRLLYNSWAIITQIQRIIDTASLDKEKSKRSTASLKKEKSKRSVTWKTGVGLVFVGIGMTALWLYTNNKRDLELQKAFQRRADQTYNNLLADYQHVLGNYQQLSAETYSLADNVLQLINALPPNIIENVSLRDDEGYESD